MDTRATNGRFEISNSWIFQGTSLVVLTEPGRQVELRPEFPSTLPPYNQKIQLPKKIVLSYALQEVSFRILLLLGFLAGSSNLKIVQGRPVFCKD